MSHTIVIVMMKEIFTETCTMLILLLNAGFAMKITVKYDFTRMSQNPG